MKRPGLVVCAIAALMAAPGSLSIPAPRSARQRALRNFPPLMLWAWDRREDLGFIDPHRVGVAYLASTIYLEGDSVAVRPRRQPLIGPRDTVVVAVARIEAHHAALSTKQSEAVAIAIARLTAFNPAAIQIDFDATRSQRKFYRDVLIDVRHRLSDTTPLTIAALASWCIYDDWIAELPIDEAVPMLYRMGSDTSQIAAYLDGGSDFVPAISRASVGIALDEPSIATPPGRRIYLFSPRAWTPDEFVRVAGEVL